ncbi:uncharacterized protein L199_003869 [Kwoniella botswanensis]|uniref:uncharacterized protein n=1 Tax=Kwoniella botswanensis TaxID=1268659 RepID=UPI00315C9B0F
MSSFNGNSGSNTGRFGIRRPDGTFVPLSFGNSNLSDSFGAGRAERELNNYFGSIPGLGPSGDFGPNREAYRAFDQHFGQFGVRVPDSFNAPDQPERTAASSKAKTNTTTGTGTEGPKASERGSKNAFSYMSSGSTNTTETKEGELNYDDPSTMPDRSGRATETQARFFVGQEGNTIDSVKELLRSKGRGT